MSYLSVQDLNQDRYLSVAIATTFAIAVSHIHGDHIQRGCLIKVLQWENYSEYELLEISNLAWKLSSSATGATNHTADAVTYAANSAHTASAHYASHFTAHSDYAIQSAYSSASSRSVCPADYTGKLKYIHNTLRALLPVILNYKVNNSKIPFNSPGKILDLLGDKYKQLFIFNLDLLT